MIELKKVLVPTDFSAASEVALRYGREFAAAFRASLYFVHVTDDPILFAQTTSDEYRASFIKESNHKLRELGAPAWAT